MHAIPTRSSSDFVTPCGTSPPPLAPAEAELETEDRIVVIEHRILFREAIIRSLQAVRRHGLVEGYSTIGKWLDTAPKWNSPPLVLLCSPDRTSQLAESLARFAEILVPPPYFVSLAENEDPRAIVEALGQGVRGYIPTSMNLVVAHEVLRVVRAGGIFAPADRLLRARTGSAAAPPGERSLFTTRQSAVLASIRRGKPNKIIAYELAMQESTVKVHVRTIMRKLKATNRTEVAYLAEKMEQQHAS